MAVKVVNAIGEDDAYEAAQHVVVKDGHLYVQTNTGTSADTLAVYAPGQWRNATASRNARASS